METDTSDIQCKNCGFLAWRVRGNDASPFHEVTVERRESGVCPTEGALRDVSNTPYCYRRMPLPIFLYDAMVQGGKSKKDSFHEATGTYHECEHFTPHRAGRSPKEHDDMIASAEAERVKATAAVDKQRRDIEQADKVRHEQWSRDDELRKKREDREDRNRHKDNRLKIALAIAGLVVAAIGYCIRWSMEPTK